MDEDTYTKLADASWFGRVGSAMKGFFLSLRNFVFKHASPKTETAVTETPPPAATATPADSPPSSESTAPLESPPGPGRTGEHPMLNAGDWFKKGVALYQANKFQKALYAFTMSIGQNADYAKAYYSRSMTFTKLDCEDEALGDLKTAARLGHIEAQQYLRQKNIAW